MLIAPKRMLLFASLLFITLPAWGNDITPVDPTSYDWAWRFYDVTDGMPDKVRAIDFDDQGQMWLAGRGGLARYDGLTATPITPTNSQTETAYFSVYSATDQSVWVGSENNGVAKFDGTIWQFYTDSLPGPTVLAITETSDGTIWVGCGKRSWQTPTPTGGLARWDGSTWHAITALKDDHVNDIFQDNKGHLWVAADSSITVYNGKGWRKQSHIDTLITKGVQTIFQDQSGAMWFGLGNGILRYKTDRWLHFALPGRNHSVSSIGQTRDKVIWAYAPPDLYRFQNEHWQLYPIPLPGPGEPESGDHHMHITPNDIIWLTGHRVVRLDYSHTKWASYIPLAGPLYQDPQHRLWFKYQNNGAVAFDGTTWRRFPSIYWPVFQSPDSTLWSGGPNGLQSIRNGTPTFYPQVLDTVTAIVSDADKTLWFCGLKNNAGRMAHYNNTDWRLWEIADKKTWGFDMTPTKISAIDSIRGHTWFGPLLGRKMTGFGVLQYDGNQWIHHGIRPQDAELHYDESEGARVYDIAIGPNGLVWAGTLHGLWFFDGTSWHMVDHPNGPGERKVVRLLFDQKGNLWCAGAQRGNVSGGLFRLHNDQWTSLTTQDGLVDNDIWQLIQAQDGTLWVGTVKGVNRLSKNSVTTFLQRDGLYGSNATRIFQDTAQSLWFTNANLNGNGNGWSTRYQPDALPPQTVITFTPGTEIPTGNLIIEWRGHDPWKDTPTQSIRYSMRLDEGSWSTFSEEIRKLFVNIKRGDHVFQVRAMDRDGNIDPTPATYHFRVPPPVWLQRWFISLMLAFLIITTIQARRIIVRTKERDRAREDLLREMSNELQTARDLQMALMPTHPPLLDGIDLSGRCIPASHVGGDYFQYFTRENELVLTLADVTGHAMEAAIPVVMFSGILENQIVLDGNLENVYQNLNGLLCRRLENQRTFVCFVMAEINLKSRNMRLSNGACPCPYHFRATLGEVEELQTEAYPLGVNLNTDYEIIHRQLSPGDYLIFCSDGIIEAVNAEEEPFGFDRVEQAIREICKKGQSASAVIDHILDEVATFVQDQQPTDDMTCMVMHLES